ncbi:hypothetical protein HOK51_04160 [Candidatus Woesearchaeota archaeon]|jgi:hypothetical protein|nr:hypothetical protein [Candidatus Woesearchaeota archaeon]MBT6519016.1 hypothetical protein [Candidatus Woesearchaeota archaeon]MBT7368785.1 hypothetical protein [Candidatus Woesearchaeota archaeon]
MNYKQFPKTALVSLVALGLAASPGCSKIFGEKIPGKKETEIIQERLQATEFRLSALEEVLDKQINAKIKASLTETNNDLTEVKKSLRKVDLLYGLLSNTKDSKTYVESNDLDSELKYIKLKKPVIIKGKLVEIKTGSINYHISFSPKLFDCVYPITWLTVNDGQTYDLIFPETGGFHKGYVEIEYWPAPSNKVNQLKFIKEFISDYEKIGSENGKEQITTQGIVKKVTYVNQNKKELPKENKNKKEDKTNKKLNQVIEGTIIETYPGFIQHYYDGDNKGSCGSYPINWVLIKTRDNEILDLVYPSINGIHKGPAKIKFVNLPEKKFKKSSFLKSYFYDYPDKNLKVAGSASISADGIIDVDGIDYNL